MHIIAPNPSKIFLNGTSLNIALIHASLSKHMKLIKNHLCTCNYIPSNELSKNVCIFFNLQLTLG